MKRAYLALLMAVALSAGCAGQPAWQDPYHQHQTGPQPPVERLIGP